MRGSVTVVSVAACLAQSMLMADRAAAASYFCAPQPIKLGSYRPDDTSEELDIRVKLPLDRFWFDDRTGDYQADGAALEPKKLTVPLAGAPRTSLAFLVQATFDAGQCVASGMGIHPTKTNEATESITK